MRFAFLGSGSGGNAIVIEAGATRILVDCGFSCREMERRLARVGMEPASLDAILITHEHDDHVRGAARFAGRHRLPLWLTPGTCAGWTAADKPAFELFSPHDPFVVRDLEITPFPIPHDAREPCQFVVSDGGFRIGILSDLGSVTAHIRDLVADCQALLLECNHDAPMLACGPYPAAIKRRVGGALGHLSNDQAAAFLAGADTGNLQHVVATHLSAHNNTPEQARGALAGALGCGADWVAVADQREGLSWRALTTR